MEYGHGRNRNRTVSSAASLSLHELPYETVFIQAISQNAKYRYGSFRSTFIRHALVTQDLPSPLNPVQTVAIDFRIS